ncbi:hypothetical protein EYF80_012624 [Liparis tanakae]|uniref:Uncharacterized protein n=1 Tax=Liparis tanakae TaxID=230148 RepID=A0A4Z2IHI9_9TELE|nr:hypothetical protein EYF80_012624 [Liparis tanakae]
MAGRSWVSTLRTDTYEQERKERAALSRPNSGSSGKLEAVLGAKGFVEGGVGGAGSQGPPVLRATPEPQEPSEVPTFEPSEVRIPENPEVQESAELQNPEVQELSDPQTSEPQEPSEASTSEVQESSKPQDPLALPTTPVPRGPSADGRPWFPVPLPRRVQRQDFQPGDRRQVSVPRSSDTEPPGFTYCNYGTTTLTIRHLYLGQNNYGLTVTRVELPKSPEARAPLSEIVIVLVRVRRRRLQRTEGPGDGSPTLVSIDLDGVVRRRCGIIVCLVEPHVDEFVDVHAVRAGVLPRPRHELQVGLDVLARQVAADAIRVLQRGDVEGLRVLLAASFIIIADNIFPYVLVIFYNQRLILVSPQGHKKYYYYCQKDGWKEKGKKEEEV